MIILRLLGGLGNQLFIYAFGRALEQEYKLNVYFDTYSGFKRDDYKRNFELDNFNVKIKKANFYDSFFYPISKRSRIVKNILYPTAILIEEDKKFSIVPLKELSIKHKKIYLQGYFQQPKYFESIKEELKKELTIKTELSESAKIYLEKINNTNSVAVHIRRKERKDTVPIEFYLNHIKSLEHKISGPRFFIFSDDIEWCKINFAKKNNMVFVKGTSNQIEDFWLLKNCRHFIIGNSTFSWWASWLGYKNNAKIIQPKLR